ncbi:hypothetical protein EMCRGX_G029349 [Ephydatia muelleri]
MLMSTIMAEFNTHEGVYGDILVEWPSILPHQCDTQQAIDLPQCVNYKQCHLHGKSLLILEKHSCISHLQLAFYQHPPSHASSWLTVIPSERQGLHLDPPVFQTALKWWLGLDTAEGSHCALCPDKMLDPLGHHATTCKRGGDLVFRHNKLRIYWLKHVGEPILVFKWKLVATSLLITAILVLRMFSSPTGFWAKLQPVTYQLHHR